MSMPTVVLASHSAQLGCDGLEMARVAATLRRYEPVALLGEDGPLVDVLRRDGVHTEVARMQHAPADVAALARWLSSLRPGLVHVYTPRAGVFAGVAARAVRIPVVWHVHDRYGVAARAVMWVVAAVATADSPSTRSSVPGGVPSALVPSPGRAEQVYDCVVGGRAGRAPHLVVNGRFRTRPTSGVERFAENVTTRLTVPTRISRPPRALSRGALGHIWEQVLLPLNLSREATLWSPCNFGPVTVRRQIVTVHDLAPCDHPEWFSRPYRAWFNLLVPLLTRRARAVTTVSPFTRDRLAHRFGLDPAAVRVLPNGCELSAESTPHAPPQTEDAYVLAVGSVDPRKNLDGIHRAVARARLRHPTLRLVVTGDASTRVFTRQPQRASGLDWFAGQVPDKELASLYAGARCLVYPSFYEGFGLPPLEAMALGTRVVASRLAPIEEVCGPVAVYVDPWDPDDIARGIEHVLDESDHERAAALAEGRARALSYTWGRTAELLDDLAVALRSREGAIAR